VSVLGMVKEEKWREADRPKIYEPNRAAFALVLRHNDRDGSSFPLPDLFHPSEANLGGAFRTRIRQHHRD
jgi:hypothetical protein